MRGAKSLAVVAVALLSACAPRVVELPPQEGARPAAFPEQVYVAAAAQGRPVFRVDPTASLITIDAYRGGSLARLGHDHVIASHDVRGYVLPDAGRSDLYVALDRLVVDEPQLRTAAGFDTQPSADDIAGTRRNMLGSGVLDAQHHPFAVIGVRRVAEDGDDPLVDASITLHGATHVERISVQIDAAADGRTIDVSGRLALRQTDFGIAPLSILGGAIQVQDRVDLQFRIHAVRVR